jgi:hypothetical protein
LIANLYQKALLKELDSFVANTSAEIKEYVENGEDSEDNLIENISMDEIELAFTAPNYLSYQDLFSLCTLIPDEVINSLDNKKYYLKLRELLTVYLKDVLP